MQAGVQCSGCLDWNRFVCVCDSECCGLKVLVLFAWSCAQKARVFSSFGWPVRRLDVCVCVPRNVLIPGASTFQISPCGSGRFLPWLPRSGLQHRWGLELPVPCGSELGFRMFWKIGVESEPATAIYGAPIRTVLSAVGYCCPTLVACSALECAGSGSPVISPCGQVASCMEPGGCQGAARSIESLGFRAWLTRGCFLLVLASRLCHARLRRHTRLSFSCGSGLKLGFQRSVCSFPCSDGLVCRSLLPAL